MAQKVHSRQVAQERSNNNNNTQHHRKKSSSNTVAAFQASDLTASLLYKPFGDVGAKLDLHWKQLVDILSGSTSNNNTENVSSGRQIASQSNLLTKVAATIVRCRQQLHGTTQQEENNNKKLLEDVLQGSVSSSSTVMSMAAKKRFSKAIGHIVDGDSEAFIEELIAGVLKEAPLLTSDCCGASASTFSSFAPVGLHYLHAQLLCAAAGSKSELGTKKKMQISNLLSEHCIGTALSVGVCTVSDDQQDDDESAAASCWVFSTTDPKAQKKLLLELFRFHVSFILESKLEHNIEEDVRKGYLQKYNATMLQVASGGDVAFVKAVEAMVEQSCDSYLMQEGQRGGYSSALSTSIPGENNGACSVAKIPRYATAAAKTSGNNDAAASFSSPVHNKTNDFVKEASSSSTTTKSTSAVARRSSTALDKLRSLLLGGETITSLRGLTIIGVVLLIVTLLVRYYYLRRGGSGSSSAPPSVGHRGGVSSAAMNSSRRALSL